MARGEGSQEAEEDPTTGATATSAHIAALPAGLTQAEFDELIPVVRELHTYRLNPGQCSSLLAQRIHAPPATVWSIVRRFDKPQVYKNFIKSCSIRDDFTVTVGCTR